MGRTEHALVSAAALTLHLGELVDAVETLKVLLLLNRRYLKFAFTCLSRVLWVWSRGFSVAACIPCVQHGPCQYQDCASSSVSAQWYSFCIFFGSEVRVLTCLTYNWLNKNMFKFDNSKGSFNKGKPELLVQLKWLQIHCLFLALFLHPPSSSIKTLWQKSHPGFPFLLRAASVPITSYTAAHLTNQYSICLYYAVMCKKQIKVFGESHCSFHFYMMGYSVFAQAVLTDRVENIYLPRTIIVLSNTSSSGFELDLLPQRQIWPEINIFHVFL